METYTFSFSMCIYSLVVSELKSHYNTLVLDSAGLRSSFKSQGQCSELFQTSSKYRAVGDLGSGIVTKPLPALVSILNIVRMSWFLRT